MTYLAIIDRKTKKYLLLNEKHLLFIRGNGVLNVLYDVLYEVIKNNNL